MSSKTDNKSATQNTTSETKKQELGSLQKG